MYPNGMVDVPGGDYVSLREAADVIGCTKRNAQNYIDAGLLPAINVDGFWIVRRRDAKAFVRPPKGRPKKGVDPAAPKKKGRTP
jgi:hypothetical protein